MPGESEARGFTRLHHRFPVAVGLVMFAATLGSFWLTGALIPTQWSSLWTSPLQITGLALANSAIPAYLIATLGYATRRSREMVGELVEMGVVASDDGERRVAELDRIPLIGTLGAALGGLVLSAFNIPWAFLGDIAEGPAPVMGGSIVIGSILIWSIVARVAYRQIRSAAIFSRMGRDDARVDVFGVDRLSPFGKIGTLNVLIVVGALSLMPLQSLDAELRWFNYLNGVLLGIPGGILLLFLPMRGAHQRIREAKAREIEQLDRAIEAADRGLEPPSLDHLNNLLTQRERILALRNWPLDLTAYRRVLLYVVIPPVAWIGAALVEILLNAVLG